MKFSRLGKSGLKISQITFGSALTIGTEDSHIDYAQKMIDAAWELGIRSFDTSNNYGMGKAEYLIGKALKRYPREEYIVATKGSWPIADHIYGKGLSRKHILWAFENSISQLDVSYIDIYYAHRYDPDVPMEEVVRVFNYLINTGKILYWATSEWPAAALKECHEVCDRLSMEKPILDQFIYSYAINKSDQNGVRDFCERNNIAMLGFSPLAQGLLTGKYRSGVPENSRIAKSNVIGYDKTQKIYEQTKSKVDHFVNISEKYGVNSGHAALQWVLRRGVLPVLGASSPQQLADNIDGISTLIPDEFWSDIDIIWSN